MRQICGQFDAGIAIQPVTDTRRVGDLTDWNPSVVGDAFGNASLGVASLMTAVDLREMNVIGWNRASLTT